MASSFSSSTSKISISSLPIFKGEGYEHWSYRMKTFFRSQNLWKIIEEEVVKEGPKAKVLENEKADAKAVTSY